MSCLSTINLKVLFNLDSFPVKSSSSSHWPIDHWDHPRALGDIFSTCNSACKSRLFMFINKSQHISHTKAVLFRYWHVIMIPPRQVNYSSLSMCARFSPSPPHDQTPLWHIIYILHTSSKPKTPKKQNNKKNSRFPSSSSFIAFHTTNLPTTSTPLS